MTQVPVKHPCTALSTYDQPSASSRSVVPQHPPQYLLRPPPPFPWALPLHRHPGRGRLLRDQQLQRAAAAVPPLLPPLPLRHHRCPAKQSNKLATYYCSTYSRSESSTTHIAHCKEDYECMAGGWSLVRVLLAVKEITKLLQCIKLSSQCLQTRPAQACMRTCNACHTS